MAAPTSAYSARPSSLAKAGPKAPSQTADDLLAELDAPVMPEPAQSAPPAQAGAALTADSLLAELDSPAAEAPVPVDPNDFAIQEPSSFMGVNTDIGQQLKDMPDRIAGKIAGEPKYVKLTLEKRLGKENVRMKGDDIYFKHKGDKAFRKFDPIQFEVVNDLFADFYKENMMMAGGALGGMAGAPAGPIGAFAGGAAGAGAAATAVNAQADRQMGVVRPDNYLSNKEPGIVGDVTRGAERLAKGAEEGLIFESFNKLFNVAGAKWAAHKAKRKAIKELGEIPVSERLTENIRTNLETLGEMKKMGLTTKIAGTDVEIPAHQLLPNLPDVSKNAASVAAEKSFQNAQNQAAENFGSAALDLVESAAGVTKGRMKEAIRTGVPSAKEVSASEVSGLFNRVRRAEGEVIGEFRKLAKATATKNPLPSPATAGATKDIFAKLGVRTGKDGNLAWPKTDALMQTLGTDSEAFVSGFKNDLNAINKKLIKGGLNVDELIGLSQTIGGKNEGARRIGGMYKSMVGKLSSAIRDDSRNGITMVLDPADAATYTAKMERFGTIAKSMDQLEGYLRDDIGMNTFAKGLVNKGKEGLANLRAAKEFLVQENPEMYRNLIGEYMEELALKHRDPKRVSGFNAKAMRKELVSLGGEYLDELLPGKGPLNKGLVLRSFDLSDQVEQSIIKGTDVELMKDAKKAVSALSWYHRGVNAVQGMMNFHSKDARLLKMLSKEGVESFLADTPKKNRAAMRQTLSAILTLARKNGTLQTIDNVRRKDEPITPDMP